MVVQHNLRAMNSNRMLGLTANVQSKSTEKLSSGYKINRAADDAAGLSISEKMRKQIRGLSQASLNAADGISSVQTAEGALNEVQDMLQRMNELAVKASNGTMSENDRSYIQNEIDQLVTEIDRVAETTKFNETYLLKGDEGTTTKTLAAHDAGFAGKLVDNGDGTSSFALSKALENGDEVSIAGKNYTIGKVAENDAADGYGVYDDQTANSLKSTVLNVGDSITVDDGGTEKTYTMVNKIAVTDAVNWKDGTTFTVEDEAGNSTEYTVATATSIPDKEIKADEVDDFLANHLANPAHKVIITNWSEDGTPANTNPASIEVVDALETGEVSYIDSNNTGKGYVGKTVDDLYTAKGNGGNIKSVTVGGEETTITAKPPVSGADIAEVVSAMKAGDELQIVSEDGTKTTNITIADKTDIEAGEYTVADALNTINNADTDVDNVEFKIQASNKDGVKLLADKGITNSTTLGTTANQVTVIGSVASEKADGTISKEDAYRMMADELAKASSIGTDEAATVVNNNDGTFTITQGTVEVKDAITLNLHVGADADATNKISVDISAMTAAGLGVKGLDVTDATGTDATYAIDAIQDAIQQVSTQRSALGAVQNRLEHTIANLDNVVENTTAAESQIRDTDMATEMVKYSNNNILAQAGQAMLAQANQANQGVLSLLG